MANTLFNVGREGFLTEVTVGGFVGKYDWVSDNIRVALIDGTYEFDVTNPDYSYISESVVADVALTGRSSSGDGTATAANTTFPSVTGAQVLAVVIYRSDNAGTPDVEANCPLIAYLDTDTAGLPVTPNGGDITVLWNGGTGEIFKL